MLRQAGQRTRQAVNKAVSQAGRGPVFQRADVNLVAYDGKMRVQVGAHVDIGGKNFHVGRAACIG